MLVGLRGDEYYVQFVPPATFGVILDRATSDIYLVRADGKRALLRREADRIYALRGFIGLRQREGRTLNLGRGIEDKIIRQILYSFETIEKLRMAVLKFCPSTENAQTMNDDWGRDVFQVEDSGCDL